MTLDNKDRVTDWWVLSVRIGLAVACRARGT